MLLIKLIIRILRMQVGLCLEINARSPWKHGEMLKWKFVRE